MFYLRRVVGKSMLPNFKPGQIILACRWMKLHKNQVVLADIKGHQVLKRIAKVYQNPPTVDLSSDNSKFGSHYSKVHKDNILGTVIWPLKKNFRSNKNRSKN